MKNKLITHCVIKILSRTTLILIFVIASCGGEGRHKASPSLLSLYQGLEKELNTEFMSFATFSEAVPCDEPLKDGDEVIGCCTHSVKYIHVLDRLKTWKRWKIEAVLLHELAHCDYGIKHEDTGIMAIKFTHYETEEDYEVERAKLINKLRKIEEEREKLRNR